MPTAVVTPDTKPVQHPGCRHHWFIEPAAGPTSHARCKNCGSERDFFNDPEAARIDSGEVAGAARL